MEINISALGSSRKESMILPKAFYEAEEIYLTPPDHKEIIEIHRCNNSGEELTEKEIENCEGYCSWCYEEEKEDE